MWPDTVVEIEVAADPGACFRDRGVGVEIHLLVFYRAPEALHEHIVPPASPAVHADGDFLALEDAGEVDAGELAALVGIEDVWFSEARQRFLQCLDAKAGVERDRQPPSQYAPAEPVDERWLGLFEQPRGVVKWIAGR